MPKDNNVVTAAELGDWLGLSTKSIATHAASKVLVRAERGRYKLRESVRNYAKHLRESASGRGTQASAERARLVAAQADAVERKNAVARGEYVRATDVQSEWSAIVRHSRAAIMAVPARISSRLPHLTAHDMAEMDTELREALTTLSKETPK